METLYRCDIGQFDSLFVRLEKSNSIIHLYLIN